MEAVHRGDVVEVDASGRMLHVIGDPDRVVNLRSAVKPFGLLALLRAKGTNELDLTSEELALMASSHSGEDLHVRTLQAMYRRLQISTSVLQPGVAAPLDALTAARLARDGERPGVVRHMCSGQHTVFILLAKLGGWPAPTRNSMTMTVNTVKVMTAFEIEVTTRIHDGNRALVSRNPCVESEARPLLVPSAKKSNKNRPMIRLSL